jgi:hypothetical protein
VKLFDEAEASKPDLVEDATVLGPIKAKPLRVAAKTRPALTGPALRAAAARFAVGAEECSRRGSNKRMGTTWAEGGNSSCSFGGTTAASHLNCIWGPP